MGRRPKRLFVLFWRLAVWGLCLGVFAGAFALLEASPRSLIAGFSFSAMYALMARVYGGFDVGGSKSRSIVFSMSFAVFFADLAGHFFLCVLDAALSPGGVFVYERPLLLAGVFAVQLGVMTGMAYAGNAIYFAFKKPQRCLIVTPPGTDPAPWAERLAAYPRKYAPAETASSDEPALTRRIEAADAVFLFSLPEADRARIAEYCYRQRKDLYYNMELSDVVAYGGQHLYLDDTTMIFSPADKIPIEAAFIKRAMDIVIAVAGLALTAPVCLAAALAIKLEDGGPVFYRQQRHTRDGAVFEIVKFRSMSPEAGGDHRSVTRDDPRVTRVGRVLRRLRIDELPQFWNVLRGDMSVVGPRPEMLENMERYTAQLPEFSLRLRAKAGITGLAQVYGRYNSSPKDKMILDLLYIERYSPWLDIKIILRTILVLLSPGHSTAPFERDGQ